MRSLRLSLFHGRHSFIKTRGSLLNKLLDFLAFLLKHTDLSNDCRVGHEGLKCDAALEFQILEEVLAVFVDELGVQLAEERFLGSFNLFLNFSLLVF